MANAGPQIKERPGLERRSDEERHSGLRHHVGPALGAILISVALYLVVHNEERLPADFDVTVTFDHPDNVMILGEHPEVVKVKFQATRNQLHELTKNDFRVIVPNREGDTGSRLEVLGPADVQAPRGVVITQVLPSNFTIEYDRRVRKRLPIEVQVVGEVAEGYEIDPTGARLSKDSVYVVGPRTRVSELERVQTLPVSIADKTESFRREAVGLTSLPDPIVYEEAVKVDVNMPIRARQGRRTMTGVEVVLLPGQWRAMPPNPRRLDVVLAGPIPSLRELTKDALKVLVDLSKLEPQDADYKTEVLVTVDQELCPGCAVVTTEPQSFVHIRVLRQALRPTAPALPTEPDSGQTAASTTEDEPVGDQHADNSATPPAPTDDEQQNG